MQRKVSIVEYKNSDFKEPKRNNRTTTSYTLASLLATVAISTNFVDFRDYLPVPQETEQTTIFYSNHAADADDYDCIGALETCVLQPQTKKAQNSELRPRINGVNYTLPSTQSYRNESF